MNKILVPRSGRRAVRRPAFSIRLAAACAILLFARLCPAQAMPVVTLISPANGATVTTATPTLQWAAYPGAIHYEIYVTDTTTAVTVTLPFTSDTQITVSPALQAGRQYQWFVLAWNQSYIGESAAWLFTVLSNPPALSINKTHAGNFTQGQTGARYTVTVSNAAAAAPTNGPVTVTETIPSGLNLVSMAGAGWTCASNTCTRSDVLAAGASYPAITVTVNVAGNAPSPQVNAVSVSGGGSGSANTTDFTTIILLPVLSIGKTHAGNFTQGQAGATYTVTASNAASAGPTNGTVTVTETAPTGLTLASMAGTGWTCASNTCTRSDVLAAGASFPAITVTVNVAANATSPQVNAVSVSGGGSGSANATDSTTIIPLAPLTVGCSPQSGSYTPGASYSTACTASGGIAPYNWSFSNLPSWLKPSGTSGAAITLSGTVPAAPPNSYSVGVTVADSSTPIKPTTSTTTVTINVSAATLTVVCTPQSGFYPGGAQYSTNCTASGGTAPLTWSFATLPSWLNSSGTSGAAITLSGTVPAPPPGSYSVAITVTDSAGNARQTANTTVTINVLSAVQLSCSPSSGPVMAGVSYTAVCTASGGAPGYNFSLSAGSPPPGIAGSLAGATATFSGKPAAPGAYNYTLQVTDSAGQVATQSFSGTIGAAPSVGISVTAVASAPNQQTASLTLGSAPPVALSGTLCLTFSANSSVVNAGAYQSQEVVFANGTTSAACSSTLKTTLAFTVPAGSATAVWSGNSSQFSAGTVAGTITVTMQSLVDPSGNSALPSLAPSQTVTVAAGEPALSGSPTMTVTSSTVTVVFAAATSTRHVTGVNYVFNPGAIAVSVSFTSGAFAGYDQSQWFATSPSLATGGAFSLSATFPCTNCSALTGVQVTLTN